MNTSSGESMMSAIQQKKPLLINTVIKRILELSHLSDVKNFRLICQDWNSVAEPLLRRKAKILFTADFGTSDYLKHYSDPYRSAVPFTAFKFTNCFKDNLGYLETDLDDFFNKYGKNIKSVELDRINIWKDKGDLQRMKAINISHWLELLPDNVDKLKINVCHSSTRLLFNLKTVARVKSLWLSQCDVFNSSYIRIAPLEIALISVTFVIIESKTKLSNVFVNDFVDFNKCSNIKLYKSMLAWPSTEITFDMSKDIVDANKVQFMNIKMLNSEISKIKTDFLSVLIDPYEPSEAIKMQTKELDIGICASINLTYLPGTIEKLRIRKSFCVPHVVVPLNLPNLKYLHFDPPTIENEGSLSVFEIVSCFKNCSNLVDVHLGGVGWNVFKLDVAWLPKSVKSLKLTTISDIVFFGDSHPVDVEVLLLDDSLNSVAVEMILEKILVKLVSLDKDCGKNGTEKAEDFISFVRKNTQLEKIVINTLYGLKKCGSSGKKCFLQFVGKESLCYEFNNQIAKAISKDEFEKYYDINCMNSLE